MLDRIKRHALTWLVTAASTVVGLQLIAPSWLDFILDIILIGMIFMARAISQTLDK